MYEFHDKFIKSKYSADLLIRDTGSLVYKIKTEDVYEDFHEDKTLLDFSDYPLNSKFYDHVNKIFIGKMNGEFKEKTISEFVGLRSKMYSLIDVDSEEVKKSKRSE